MKLEIKEKSEASKMSNYERTKYCAVLNYFYNRLNGYGKMDASKISAELFWRKDASETYRPFIIRTWARQYLKNRMIPKSNQGRHIKTYSLLSDETIAMKVLAWFRSQDPQKRDLHMLKTYIDDEIIMNEVGQHRSVSISTLNRFLLNNGFSFKKITKQVYMDGHEREDVVEYRKTFAADMMALKKRMETFDDNDYSVVVQPVLEEGQKKLVMVTHDESTFYANDYKNIVWLGYDERVLRKKGLGGSLMVSEFLCPCHGSVSRVIKACGQDNWWTSADMVNQLKNEAIDNFERMHPDCQGLFLFDQSSNHAAMAPDALLVEKLNLNDSRVPIQEPKTLRDTFFLQKLRNGTIQRIPL